MQVTWCYENSQIKRNIDHCGIIISWIGNLVFCKHALHVLEKRELKTKIKLSLKRLQNFTDFARILSDDLKTVLNIYHFLIAHKKVIKLCLSKTKIFRKFDHEISKKCCICVAIINDPKESRIHRYLSSKYNISYLFHGQTF